MQVLSFISSLKPRRREHWIILSIFAYSLVGVLKYYVPSALCNVITLLSSLTFIIVVCKHSSGLHVKGLTGLVYAFLIIWSLCLTFHMFFIADIRRTFNEYHGLTTWLLAYFGSPMFLPNLVPFVILAFPRHYKFDFSYLWKVMWLMCILYLCYYPSAFWSMTHYTWSFDQVSGTEWERKARMVTSSLIALLALLLSPL